MMKPLMRSVLWACLYLGVMATAMAMETLTLPIGDRVKLDFTGLQYAVVEKPELFDVQSGDDHLRIKALRSGNAVLHVWTQGQGRQSFLLKAERKQVQPASASDEGQAQPMKFHYETQWGSGEAKSSLPQNCYVYHWGYQVISAQGDTPLGSSYSLAQYDTYDSGAGLSYAQSAFYGDGNRLTLGDQDLVLSTLAAPYVSFQGLRYMLQPVEQVELNVLGGVSGKKWWGGSVWSQGPLRHTFGGAQLRLGSKSRSYLELSWLAGEREELSSQNMSVSRQTVSNIALSAAWQLPRGTQVYAEAGHDGSQAAALAGLRFAGTHLQVDASYKQLPSGYRSFTQYFGQDGTRGMFIDGRLWLNPELSMTGVFNAYDQLQFPDQYPSINHMELSAALSYRPEGGIHWSLSGYKYDHRSDNGGGLHHGLRLQAEHPFAEDRSTYAYVRINPTWLSDSNTTALDETLYKGAGGIEFNFASLGRLGIEREERLSSRSGRSALDQIRIDTRKLFYFDTPLHFQSNLRAYNESFTSQSPRGYALGKIEMGWQLADKQRLFAAYERLGIDGSDSENSDKGVDRFQYGVQLDYASSLQLAEGHATLIVRAFGDSNGSGVWDPDEPMLHGLRVLVYPGGLEQMLGSDGAATFRSLRAGDTVLMVDTRSIPSGHTLLDRAEQQVHLLPSGRHEVWLRFAVPTERVVRLVWDRNHNGQRDEGDEPLNGVRVLCKPEGRVLWSNHLGELYVPRPAQDSSYILTIDPKTLPKDAARANLRLTFDVKVNTAEVREWLVE